MKSCIVVLFLTLFSSLACADAPSELDTYYPLAAGNNWIYSFPMTGLQQLSVKPYNAEQKTYTLELKSRAGGKDISVFQKSADRIEKTGIIGRDGLFKPLLPPQTILLAPLKKGSVWEYNDGDMYKQQLKVIDFINITVNAGKFKKVVKIEKTAVNTKDRSKDGGKSFLYYAPNIGLIKEETIGKNGRTSVVMELVSYNLGGKRKK